MRTETFSLCKHCYGVVPAYVEASSSGTVLTKNCPQHGEQVSLVDPSKDFYDWLLRTPKTMNLDRPGFTALDVTNKCNVRCPGCYALPDDSEDKSVQSIVSVASSASREVLGLMGAEPTMREDLPFLISSLKKVHDKPVLMYSNGIRLEDPAYLDSLAISGLDQVAVSLHLPSYIGDKAYGSKIAGLLNLKGSSVGLNHVSISLKTLSDMPDAIQEVLKFDYSTLSNGYIRIRAPSAIGGLRNEPCSMSDMVSALVTYCTYKGIRAEVVPFTNHIYAVMVAIEGRNVMLVRWPTVEEINLTECQKSPMRALFVPEAGETHILHQVLLTERVRSGGALPPEPVKDCPSSISGKADSVPLVTVQLESFSSIFNEVQELLPKHWDELALYKDKVKLDPQYEVYFDKEKLGEILIATVRADKKIVGYYCGFIRPALHYRGMLTCYTDIYFLHPAMRRHDIGARLFSFVKEELKRRKVQCWMAGDKMHSSTGDFLQLQGFSKVENHHSMWIGE